MLVVPDASVILKWVLPPEREAHSDRARDIRNAYLQGDLDILVPALWLFEVGNILTIKFSQHAVTQLRLLSELEMDVVGIDAAWRERCLGLVKNFGVTFYDAAYHATALVSGGLLVSADGRYLRKAGVAGNARHLGDWAR